MSSETVAPALPMVPVWGGSGIFTPEASQLWGMNASQMSSGAAEVTDKLPVSLLAMCFSCDGQCSDDNMSYPTYTLYNVTLALYHWRDWYIIYPFEPVCTFVMALHIKCKIQKWHRWLLSLGYQVSRYSILGSLNRSSENLVMVSPVMEMCRWAFWQ